MPSRFEGNPLISPADVVPMTAGFNVCGVFNPGVFQYKDKTGLLLRVAETPPMSPGSVHAPVLNPDKTVRVMSYSTDDPLLKSSDPRIFMYNGKTFLTSLSHFRLAWSHDGIRFTVDEAPVLTGEGELETFGIEDCRVTRVGETYYLTYSAVSHAGVGIGLISTLDWKQFTRHGMILPPHNKDCVIFPEKIGEYYYALHRPSGLELGGNYIWIARSKDLLYWGDHRCVAETRPQLWDSVRIGAGAAPIKTAEGWIEIYHGANEHNRYCLGAILLDLEEPWKVLARTNEPIMEPVMDYEKKGFFGNVVFTNGHTLRGDILTVYYGASDECVCGATFSLHKLVDLLRK